MHIHDISNSAKEKLLALPADSAVVNLYNFLDRDDIKYSFLVGQSDYGRDGRMRTYPNSLPLRREIMQRLERIIFSDSCAGDASRIMSLFRSMGNTRAGSAETTSENFLENLLYQMELAVSDGNRQQANHSGMPSRNAGNENMPGEERVNDLIVREKYMDHKTGQVKTKNRFDPSDEYEQKDIDKLVVMSVFEKINEANEYVLGDRTELTDYERLFDEWYSAANPYGMKREQKEQSFSDFLTGKIQQLSEPGL